MGHKKKKAEKAQKKLSDSPKQIRARARRGRATEEDLAKLYKPVDEWDMEELARGRPRDVGGGFRGKAPNYITRAVHEECVRRFQEMVRTEMNQTTVEALKILDMMLRNEETDDKGRPMVPAATKADISKFLIEHVIGKPTQRQEVDISVKLQSILSQATVTVTDGEFQPGLPMGVPGSVMEADSWEADEEDDADVA